jgi:hypothetical protein
MSKRLPPVTEQEVLAAVQALLEEEMPVSMMNIRSVLARAHPPLEFRESSSQVQQHLSNYYQKSGGKNE